MALHPNWKALSTVNYSVKQFIKEGQPSTSSSRHAKSNLFPLNHTLTGEEARQAYEETVGLTVLQPNEPQIEDFTPKNRTNNDCKESTAIVPVHLGQTNDSVARSLSTTDQDVTYTEYNERKNNAQRPLVNTFLKAAQDNNVNAVAKCLYDGANINATDPYGWTALMCAACSGATDVVKLLLQHKADINVKDKSGYTSLFLARRHRHQPIIDLINEFKISDQDCPQKQCSSSAKKQLLVPFYCDICKHNFSESSQQEHATSTVHQFNTRPKSFGTIYGIPEGNKGYQILLKGGWDKEKGLGPAGSGHKFPCKTVLKRDRTGLGLDTRVPRVTHFAPNDEEAVKFRRSKKRKSTRKDRGKHISKEKRKEKELRIELS